MRWRNWRLPTKLAAVTAVPVILALALGVLAVHTQVQRSAVHQRSDRLVVLGDTVLALVNSLQRERDVTARQLATRPVASPASVGEQRQQVDAALAAMRAAAAKVDRHGDSVSSRLAEADRRIETLPALRRQVSESGLDAGTAITGYGAVIQGLLDVDRALVSEIADAALARSATALHDLAVATDQLYLQQDLVAVGIARGFVQPAEQNTLRASYARYLDKIDDFRAAASAEQLRHYDDSMSGRADDQRAEQLRRLLDVLPLPLASPFPVDAAEWDEASGATIAATLAVAGRLAAELRDSSSSLQASASDRAGLMSVILFAALVLTVAVVIAVARQLLGSLRTLRRTVLEVAEHELPATVAAIREGGLPDTAVRPVPVQTTEDIGQLARAFDAVHQQALRLAADEARLRAGYSGVFVNLSRRSQGLVQRQLQLLERLERDEEDAEQLATLFQLDHLATRMRRNNENLLVLSGSDLARRGGEPATVVDLLRAAISEIEHYQRVQLRRAPAAQVLGHAAGDLVRLLAELLDNAAAFSAPDTQVTVSAQRTDDGALLIDVVDRGIGMSDREIADANARLRHTGPVDVPASRRMGLFVVGRLASRHGFVVRLHGGQHVRGVQASVTVPAELVTAVTTVSPPPAARPAVSTEPWPLPKPVAPASTAEPNGGLPRRSRSRPSDADAPAPATNGHRPTKPVDEPAGWPDWWTASPEPAPAERELEEPTPIFDQMVSVWFQPQDRPAGWPPADPDNRVAPQPPVAAASTSNGTWQSAADQGWRAAAQVSNSVPSHYTNAGLPKRTPRQSLLPGSVAEAASDEAVPAERDADEIRGRLSSLRAGLNRGRHGLEPALDERAAGQ